MNIGAHIRIKGYFSASKGIDVNCHLLSQSPMEAKIHPRLKRKFYCNIHILKSSIVSFEATVSTLQVESDHKLIANTL